MHASLEPLGWVVAAASSAATVIVLAAPLPPLHIAGYRVTVTALVFVLLGRREVRGLLDTMREHPELAWRMLGAGIPACAGCAETFGQRSRSRRCDDRVPGCRCGLARSASLLVADRKAAAPGHTAGVRPDRDGHSIG
ncbi:MAG: hypothetical protein KUG77_12870 [Nannocystaceae bacterium]|nr:hypothetical protein [Nannocystaceae bacterium]